ncbi:MAG: hypothetical protein HWN79_13585 [Candidatus Lokiarchaeota archaeon]|nr:hypothetical protein [Candidatus Lokiarchaeota archaeon]
MGAGKILVIIGAILSILGTYVFGIYGGTGAVWSGIGFALNTFGAGFADPTLIAGAALYAGAMSIEIWMYYIYLIIFLVFLVAGILQFVGVKSRAVGLIFSLFPLGVGIMFILLFYTEILGIISGLFALFFIGPQFADIFPILIDIGSGIGLGAFFLVGGGALGLIGSILPRD